LENAHKSANICATFSNIVADAAIKIEQENMQNETHKKYKKK